MTTALDEGIGNVTRALKAAQMYDNTIIIFYADNGGPLVTTGKSGNNYPLKGGKTDDFEGGTRVAAFISGGFLPPSLRGGINHGYIHAADWYATLCGLVGVDPSDNVGDGVPPIDSIDQWSTILTPNASIHDGARQEMMLAYGGTTKVVEAAYISGPWKIVTGHQGGSGFWTGPVHPNSTGPKDPTRNGDACGAFSCCEGCLFNIEDDPTEHDDLRLTMPQKYAEMHARLMAVGNTTFQTDYIEQGLACISAEQAAVFYKGFRGPQCFAGTAPVVPTPAPTPGVGFQHAGAEGKGELCLTSDRKLRLAACSGTRSAGGALADAALPPQWMVGDAKTGELQSTQSQGLCIKLEEEKGWNCANQKGSNATVTGLGQCSSGPGAHGAHASNYFYLTPRSAGAITSSVLIKSHDCPKLCVARIAAVGGGAGVEIGLKACTAAESVWIRID